MKTISIRIFDVVVVSAMIAFAFFAFTHLAAAQSVYTWSGSDVDLEGWAWSSNIGWISMNCATGSQTGTSICGNGAGRSNYGVSIDNANGKISGHGWSSNIGWIRFSDNGNGCPAGSGCNARIVENGSDLEMRGWARALSHGGGWDGWISLSCANMSECGTSNYQPEFGNGLMSGVPYVWGSFVVGWTDLSGVTFDGPCASTPTSCRVDGSGYTSTDTWCRTTSTDCAVGEVCTTIPPGCTGLTPSVTNFEPDTTVVRVGDTVEVDLDVTGVTGSCVVLTIEGDSPTYTPDASFEIHETWTSPALTGATTFTLECNGAPVSGAEFTVQVIPISTEI